MLCGYGTGKCWGQLCTVCNPQCTLLLDPRLYDHAPPIGILCPSAAQRIVVGWVAAEVFLPSPLCHRPLPPLPHPPLGTPPQSTTCCMEPHVPTSKPSSPPSQTHPCWAQTVPRHLDTTLMLRGQQDDWQDSAQSLPIYCPDTFSTQSGEDRVMPIGHGSVYAPMRSLGAAPGRWRRSLQGCVNSVSG